MNSEGLTLNFITNNIDKNNIKRFFWRLKL